MKDVLTVGATEQAQSQLRDLTAIKDNLLKSVRDRVIKGEMEEKDFADLSGKITSLTSVTAAHAERHGDLTRLRVEIGQKPANVTRPVIDQVVNGLLNLNLHRKGIVQYIDSYESRIKGLYVQKSLGLSQDSSVVETFFLTGKAYLPHASFQPAGAATKR